MLKGKIKHFGFHILLIHLYVSARVRNTYTSKIQSKIYVHSGLFLGLQVIVLVVIGRDIQCTIICLRKTVNIPVECVTIVAHPECTGPIF